MSKIFVYDLGEILIVKCYGCCGLGWIIDG